jgi:dTDP-4-dehydrorhamnose 3,5-epimerase-like enzyme
VLPGAIVETNVPGNSIVGGNPAQIQGYRDSLASGPAVLVDPSRGDREVPVDGVQLLPVQLARDLRGALAAVECSFIPFPVARIFTVNDVPDGNVRGAHAHRTCHQFLWCVAGSLRCLVDDGRRRSEVLVSADGLGLYMPPMTWGTQYRYVPGTVLNVAASHAYDSGDYIREYDEFTALLSTDDRADRE